MKNKVFIKSLIIGVFTVFILIIGLFVFKNTVTKEKTYGYSTGITNISQYVDEINANASSASFVLQNIDEKNLELLEGHRYKITCADENISISVLDAKTNDELSFKNNIVTMNKNGITVKVDGLAKGNTYDIKIQPASASRGYKSTFNEATINLDYTDVLTASISEIKDNENNSIELSDNDRIVFLYTDEDDKIKLRANTDIDIEYLYSLDELSDEELESAEFTAYDKGNYLEVSTNGYLYAKAKYKNDAFSKTSVLHITNIDKEGPIATNINITENPDYMSATLTFDMDDKEESKEYGKSGLKAYVLSKLQVLPDTLVWDLAEAGSFTKNITDNGTYYLHMEDNAGNITVQEIEVDQITFYQPGYFVLILDSTNPYLVGKVYHSLMEMKADFDSHNLTNDDTVLAQIEGDIKNQSIDVENVNLELDLNGYILESREEHPTFNVKEGASLKVVDNKYDISTYFNNDSRYACGDDKTTSVSFDYTGDGQTYTVPSAGTYKIETWGAQGGGSESGKGAYVRGYVDLTENQQLYVYVGGQPADEPRQNGGFNGGGNVATNDDGTGRAGGGATDVRLVNGDWNNTQSLNSRIIVAAGGGGSACEGGDWCSNGGAGGTLTGLVPTQVGSRALPYTGLGGTQTAGGSAKGSVNSSSGLNYVGGFGYGGHSGSRDDSGAGGSGYYGGGGSTYASGGAGGSSYASGYTGCVAVTSQDDSTPKAGCANNTNDNTCSIHYSGLTFYNTTMVDGNSNMPSHGGYTTIQGNEGNGYAKITKTTCIIVEDSYDYSTFEHGTGIGTIRNVNYDAIRVNQGGTLTIGEDNSPDLMHIEYPNHETPLIQGKEKAIYTRGTFNYYDGVAIGNIALDGDVTSTPYLYDPNVITEGGNHVMKLDRATNVEALIGKTRYTTLEDAIYAANNIKGTSEDQIEIDIIVDLTKTKTVVVDNTKNIILDLNGNTFTTLSSEPILTNYGKMVLKDSFEGGKIVSNTGGNIYNADDGEITVESGEYTNNVYDSYVFYNAGGAKLTINDGLFKHTAIGENVSNHGGEVTINGGEFYGARAGNYTRASYIFYNSDSSSENIYSNVTDVTNSMVTQPTVNRGFEATDDGLSPEGLKISDATSDIYQIVDLSSYNPLVEYEVEVEADVNVREGDYFYIYYRTDESYQWYNNASNRTAYVTGEQGTQKYKTILKGGSIYRVHVGFYSMRNNNVYPDDMHVYVKSIKVKERRYNIGKTTINAGTFGDNWVSWSYVNESYYNYSIINGGEFNTSNSISTSNGDITINGGNVNAGVYNYNNNGITVNGGYVNYIENRYGNVHINGGKVNNMYNISEGAYITGVGYIPEGNYINITGGEILGRIENRNELNINGGIISGYIDNYNKEPLIIKNATFSRNVSGNGRNSFYSIKMDVTDGELRVDNCIFNSILTTTTDYNSIPVFYGIYNASNSQIGIDNSTFNITGKKGYTNPNNANTYNMIYGIFIGADADTYIDNTKINVQTDDVNRLHAYAFYNAYKGDVMFGKYDETYEEDRVLLDSNYQALYNPQSNIYFYDGVIKGNTLATDDVFYKIEKNTSVYRYNDEAGTDIIKLSTHIPNVLNVDTEETYSSLGEALDSVTGTANLRFLNKYNYSTASDTYEIKDNQDITLDLNGKNLYLGNGLLINGKLNIINTSEDESDLTSHAIINNSELSINAGHWLLEIAGDEGISNNGKLTIGNSYIQTTEITRGESIINNKNELIINTGAYLTTGDYPRSHVITNRYSGRIIMNDGTLNSPSMTTENKIPGKIIYNEGGYVEIDGGTITGASVKGDYAGTAPLIFNTSYIPEDATIQTDRASGTVIATNNGRSIIPIDLTNYTGDVTVKIKYDGGPNTAIALLEQIDTTTYFNGIPNSLINDTEYQYRKEVSTTAQGGKKYYLHFVAGYSRSVIATDISIQQGDNVEDIIKHGKVILNNGTIYDTWTSNAGWQGDAIYNTNAYVEMNGGTIKIPENSSIYGIGINNYRNATFKMTDGLIENKGTAIQFNDLSYGIITKGKITHHTLGPATARSIEVDLGQVTISDIDIDTYYTNFNGAGWDTANIRLLNSSTLDMTGGKMKITGNADGLSGIGLRNTNVAHISNATITIDTASPASGIQQSSRGDKSYVTLDNVDVTVGRETNTGRNAAAYVNASSELKVKNSRLTGIGNNSYGIYAEGSSHPTVELSNNDGHATGFVSKTTPVIQGTTAGVYRDSGTFNFYDGIIKGTTEIIGGISDKPEEYVLVYGTEGDLNTVVLDKVELVENVDTGTRYSNIQTAINACPNDEVCNLKQLYHATLPSKITINENKIINYDLDQYKITITEGKYFENNGTLTLKSSGTGGTLLAEAVENRDSIIINNNILNIEDGATIDIGTSKESYAITNNNAGKVYVKGGTIKAEAAVVSNTDIRGRGINNLGGYVEITGGTVSASGISAINNFVQLNEEWDINNIYHFTEGAIRSWGGRAGNPTYPIDLTGYIGSVELTIDYDSGGSGYIIIDESEAWPSNTSVDARTFNVTEATSEGHVTKSFVGGKKYYMHFYGDDLLITKLYATQGENTKYFIYNGTMDIKGGLITSKNSGTIIYNVNATLNMSGGEIKCTEANTYGINNGRNSVLNVSDGTFTDLSTALNWDSDSYGHITGGTINNLGGGGGIHLENGIVDIENMKFNIGGSIGATYNSILTISDCEITHTGTANTWTIFDVARSANVTIKNINATQSFTSTYWTASRITGINMGYVYNSIVNIENVNFDFNSRYNYGIYLGDHRQTNQVNIKNSTFVGHVESGYDGGAYGIYEELGSPVSIKLSNDDNEVSTTSPYLYGETAGIYKEYYSANDSSLEFYDGKIEGKIVSNAAVTKVSEGYNLYYDKNGTDEYVILGHVNIVKNVGTGTEYDNLQSAVNNCPDNEVCNLQQLIKFYSVEGTTIPSKKNIVFDGDNKELYIVNNYNIKNYGTFKYINGNLNLASTILDISAFENHGTLYIDEGTSMYITRFIDGRFIKNYQDGKLYIDCERLEQTDVYRDITYGYPNSAGRVVYNLGGYAELNGGQIKSIYNSILNKNDYTTEDGTIRMSVNNYNVAHYDTELDLTNVSGTVSVYTEFMFDGGSLFFTIDENQSITDYTSNAFYSTTTPTIKGKASTTVQGGKKYYVHTYIGNGSGVNLTNVVAEFEGGTVEPMKRATFVMNGGTITGTTNTHEVENNNSTFIMNGGKITADFDSNYHYAIWNNRAGQTIMNDGEIENYTTGIYLQNYANAEIYGGKIYGPYTHYAIYSNYGQIDVNNTEITANNGIGVDEDSKLFMNGGSITVNSTSTGSNGIYLYRRASATIKGNVTINNPYGYGIQDNSTGTLQIGENDGLVSQTLPHITGNNIGLYIANNNSTVKMYDGLITSTNEKIQGTVDEIPTGYQFNNAGYDCFLELVSQIDNTYQYNHMNFLNINMAIEMIKSTDDKTGVIKINNDAEVQEQIVVPEGLDVTISLSGHRLTFKSDITTGIQNNGTLRIIDGAFDDIDESTESILQNDNGTVINNNGTLIIGSDGNPNSGSPIIRGTTAITGNNYQKKSGTIQNGSGGIFETVGAALARFFTFEIEPSYSYKTSTYQVNKLPDDIVLASSPTYRAIQPLDRWTNQNINVGMTSHNVALLSLVSDRDDEETKEIEYTIEVYKNGILDEFYTYKKVVSVQLLDDDTLDVDLDWFDDVKTKFRNYYLTKMTINDHETNEVPIIVDDGTTIKVYYGQVKGEEIDIVNPKTGRKSYKLAFIVASIMSFIIGGIAAIRFYYKKIEE